MNDKKVIAFKAFESDWTCRGFQYEVGKTYVHDGDVIACESGFHACPSIASVSHYYPPVSWGNHKLRKLAKVEMGGTIIYHGDKIVASQITILEELDPTRWNDTPTNIKVINRPSARKISYYIRDSKDTKNHMLCGSDVITESDNVIVLADHLAQANNHSTAIGRHRVIVGDNCAAVVCASTFRSGLKIGNNCNVAIIVNNRIYHVPQLPADEYAVVVFASSISILHAGTNELIHSIPIKH